MRQLSLRLGITKGWVAGVFTGVLGLMAAVPGWAGRNFTPQAGTWIVSGELDGKPGRGLAIDVQGNTFFMQVFGYEADGEASFYTATGTMEGSTVTAPLQRWKGGRSFGSGARDATGDGSPGKVSLSFRNGLQGTVQFPGESAVTIERFLVSKRDDPYYQKFPWSSSHVKRASRWFVYDEQGHISSAWTANFRWISYLPGSAARRLELWSDQGITGMDCTMPVDTDSVVCQIAEQTPLSKQVKSLEFRYVGEHVVGHLVLNQANAQAHKIMGFNLFSENDPRMPSSGTRYLIESFVPDYAGLNSLLMPANGTWIMADELTGQPGRGLSLDVQGDKLVMQVFAYRNDGRSSFYMGNGRYEGSRRDAFAPYAVHPSSGALVLRRYGGGRSLGGPAQSAAPVEEAGVATFRLAASDGPVLDSGTLQFPGEAEKRVIRLPLSDPGDLASRMLGQWYFGVTSGQSTEYQLVTLSRIEGAEVSNDDGSVRCSMAMDYSVQCRWMNADRTLVQGTVTVPAYSSMVNTGTAMRLSDRFGNLLGLGDAPMR